IKKLSQELKVAEDLATSIAQKNVRERMAELILMLKESYGKPSSKGTLIDLQLTREEMAEMIGATLETAIRLISEFRKEKIIEIENRKIRILNVKMLVDLAGLDLYS
ncbi:MAG: winged helix-turn-helix domain-containing protein, partial [Deltaproteobacteria bacterium]|nr:winged helix-turn-helix domain-containing protein [Deltaproteobacteria bacterium]